MAAEKENISDRSLTVTRLLNFPVGLVWDAWASPEHICNWWGPVGFTDTIHEMDFRPGGYWRHTMHGPDGTDYPNEIIFKEIIECKRIVYEHLQPRFTSTITFEAQGQRTHITWQMVFETRDELEYVVKNHRADEGLSQNVDKLEAYLVSKPKEPLVVERFLQASVAVVWRAITDREQMKDWYFDMDGFKPEAGTEFTFTGEKDGTKYIHLCQVKEVIVNKKISYSWRYKGYEGDSLVTFELFAEGNTTKLKLTHEGLETFPVFKKEDFEEGWNYFANTALPGFLTQG